MPPAVFVFVSVNGDTRHQRELTPSRGRSHAATISHHQRARAKKRQKQVLPESSQLAAQLSHDEPALCATQHGRTNAGNTQTVVHSDMRLRPGFGHYRTELYAHMPHEHTMDIFETLDFCRTQSSVSIFPNQRRHCNIVPQLQIDPLLLPAGFARLAAAGLLSPDLIVVLLRAVEHGLTEESLPQHGLVSRQYMPRRYHDFREACPCMDRQDSLDALVVHTIQIFCAIGFTEARIPTNILAMPRFSLSLALPTYIPKSDLELDCLLWIWMLTIEAFTSRTGADVVGQGKFLLSKFKQQFCSKATSWLEIEQVLRQFFWTQKLTSAWEIRWQSLTNLG